MNLKDHTQAVANQLIKALEQGTAPWQKPWIDSLAQGSQRNGLTNRSYHGINEVYLECQGRGDPRWFTFKQIQALQQDQPDTKLKLRKGSKGVPVEYWQFDRKEKDGAGVETTVKLTRPRVFYYSVFNGGDIENLPAYQPEVVKPRGWNDMHDTEQYLANVVANYHADRPAMGRGEFIQHGGNRAFYSSQLDFIRVPDKEQFTEAGRYYATVFHELCHSTGHASRLNRDLSGTFGSESYAKEELRAEIGSMLLGRQLGIGHDGQQHEAYVKSWIKVLKDNPREIFRACADAEKIQTFIASKSLAPEITKTETIPGPAPRPTLAMHM